jgi:xylulokinase
VREGWSGREIRKEVAVALVVGVDSSTQSTKVEVREADTGALLWSGRHPHPATTPPCSEQEPSAWWEALQSLLGAARAATSELAAISVAGQQHGMVCLGADGSVLRPAKLWNDTESAPDAEELVRQLGPVQWATATGSVPVASFTVTKLAWLRRNEPGVHGRVARVLLPHDWLTLQLCGEPVTDRGDASGTGYWSPAEERWRPDLLELVGLDDRVLPRVLGPVEPAGRWQGATIGPGTGDNMASALGLGLRPGDVAISIGTSGTIFTVAERPVADASGAVAGFADATGRYLPLVCTLNASKATDAVARLLGVDHAGLDALALAAEPGAGGLVLVPYLDGERTPNLPGATGTLTGLRSDVSRDQLARAAVEGVACGLLDGLAALDAAGVPTGGRVLLAGGGARSAAYRLVLADLLQRPVTVVDEDEQVAAGACVQAAAVLESCPPQDVAAAWGLGTGTELDPDPSVDAAAIRAAYRSAAARSSGAERATQPDP